MVRAARPVEAEWEAHWEADDFERHWAARAKYPELQKVLATLAPRSLVLEAGCGLGRWVVALSEQGHRVVGIDYAWAAVSGLRRHWPTVKVASADVGVLPFRSGAFDAYLSFGVVEHFEEGPLAALREARRVLRKGGLLVLTVPYACPVRLMLQRLGKRKVLVRPGSPQAEWGHFFEWRFSRREIVGAVREAGFREVEVFPVAFFCTLLEEFPFLGAREGTYELNRAGKVAEWVVRRVFPWFWAHLVGVKACAG